MATLGFGQSTGQIVQIAYVVQRIRPAIDSWIGRQRALHSRTSRPSESRVWRASVNWNGDDPVRPFG